MDGDAIARVNYYDRQFLRLADFVDEQEYHLAMRRRHNIAQHSWGIAAGLVVEPPGEEGTLSVSPGLAIDGYGRELVVPDRLPIAPTAFDQWDSDVLDVFLVYARTGGDEAPFGADGCAAPGGRFHRWVEQPRLVVERGDQEPGDRRRPAGVREADLDFGPARRPPDDPARYWPVFLGRITRDRSNPGPPVYVLDHSGRPYVEVVGEFVRAPSGSAAVQIGERFAVFVPGADLDDAREPRLTVDGDGETTLRGRCTVHGEVTADGHPVEFRPAADPPAGPPGWRIYTFADGDDREFRIELPWHDEPAEREKVKVVIGAWAPSAGSAEPSFQECLVVDGDGNLTVRGTLYVEGELHATTSEPPAPPAGPGAADQLMTALMRSADDPAAIAALIAARPENAGPLAETLRRDHPDVARAMGLPSRPARPRSPRKPKPKPDGGGDAA